jgi:hypothetical protein
MQLLKNLILTVITSLIVSFAFGQTPGKTLTAAQIIQRAIDSAGGDKVFDRIRNVESISQIVTAKGDTLSFAVKRMNFDKYYISTLSSGYQNTTMVYNKGRAATTSNQTTQQILDPLKLEELKLQSYISLEYGYKKLGYSFERKEDQKFKNFNCYVVLVSSPLGLATINYYDKKTGKLLMIIYPSLNRSVFIEHYRSKGISCPSKILMSDTLGATNSSTLTRLSYEGNLDSNWFNISPAGVHKAPPTFRAGTFKYLNSNNGAKQTREGTKQFEISGNSKTEYRIEWTTDNDYILYTLKDVSYPAETKNIRYFKVRIIGWTNNRYYCHYITSNNIGGTVAFEKVD